MGRRAEDTRVNKDLLTRPLSGPVEGYRPQILAEHSRPALPAAGAAAHSTPQERGDGMISVEFRSVGPGTCKWCRKEKDEVYSVAFGDKSFVGAMCKGDLLRAIGMKLGGDGKEPATQNGATKLPAES